VRAFIAGAFGVAATDIVMTVQECSTPSTNTCAERFAHDTAKSGGSIYNAARPLALELEAAATAVEDTIWTPLTFQAVVVMSGIADGVLVGMAVFNDPNVCH
jgi:hypothetical protein